MKATLPCNRPTQLSLFGSKKSNSVRHHWKKGICIHCGMQKSESVVTVCDCGCKTPICSDTITTHNGKLTYVFGHETLDLFEKIDTSIK